MDWIKNISPERKAWTKMLQKTEHLESPGIFIDAVKALKASTMISKEIKINPLMLVLHNQ